MYHSHNTRGGHILWINQNFSYSISDDESSEIDHDLIFQNIIENKLDSFVIDHPPIIPEENKQPLNPQTIPTLQPTFIKNTVTNPAKQQSYASKIDTFNRALSVKKDTLKNKRFNYFKHWVNLIEFMHNKDNKTYIRHHTSVIDYKDYWMGDFGIYLRSGSDSSSTYITLNKTFDKTQDIVKLTDSVSTYNGEQMEVLGRKMNYLSLAPYKQKVGKCNHSGMFRTAMGYGLTFRFQSTSFFVLVGNNPAKLNLLLTHIKGIDESNRKVWDIKKEISELIKSNKNLIQDSETESDKWLNMKY